MQVDITRGKQITAIVVCVISVSWSYILIDNAIDVADNLLFNVHGYFPVFSRQRSCTHIRLHVHTRCIPIRIHGITIVLTNKKKTQLSRPETNSDF